MTTLPAPELARADRITVRVLGVLAAAITLVTFVGTAVSGISTLASGETRLQLLTRAEVPNLGTSGGPGIVSAGFDSADVVATGLSDGTRALLTAAALADAATVAAVGGAIAWFLLMFAAGRHFQGSLFATTLVAGFALAIGPLLSTGLGGLGKMQAADELNPVAHDVFVVGFSVDAFGPAIPLLGFAVLAIAFVFRSGARLQRDTEGLV